MTLSERLNVCRSNNAFLVTHFVSGNWTGARPGALVFRIKFGTNAFSMWLSMPRSSGPDGRLRMFQVLPRFLLLVDNLHLQVFRYTILLKDGATYWLDWIQWYFNRPWQPNRQDLSSSVSCLNSGEVIPVHGSRFFFVALWTTVYPRRLSKLWRLHLLQEREKRMKRPEGWELRTRGFSTPQFFEVRSLISMGMLEVGPRSWA